MRLSLSAPDIGKREIDYVMQVLGTPQLSMGPMGERFESAFAEFIGSKFAVAVNSGTSGLQASLIAAGIKDGDRVLTTPFSFVASANCILYERAIPEFVDINEDSLNMDPGKARARLEELRESGKEARAILPVHIFGQPCDMDGIMDLASEFRLETIEDACEAIGAEYNNQKVGTFGKAAVFSFFPNKQITLGEGGVIVTDDQEFAEVCKSLRNQGRGKDGAWLSHVRLGYNFRLDEMSAALGVAQLERIQELLANRAAVAGWYTDRLDEMPGVRVQHAAPGTTRMSWFVYVVRFDPSIDRDLLMAELESLGIPSRPYFPAIHLQPFYQSGLGYRQGDFPVTEAVANSTLALPFHGKMTEDEVGYVCENLGSLVSRQIKTKNPN